MNKNKFKFWNPQTQSFVQNYKYNGYVDQLFEPDPILRPKQFIGIYDKNMQEIYEGDVVKFDTIRFTNLIGVIRYSNDYCAYVIDHNDGIEHIWKTIIDSLEIVGNIMKDYIWNEKGELIKYENTNP
jgi:uncharacterized phage protein (TIGR01671 family)